MELKLPITIVSQPDITRVHRELSIFNDNVTQSILRHEDPIKYPAISGDLKIIAGDNQIDLLKETDRQQLLDELDKLKKSAVTVHITFALEPSSEILQKLIAWLRQEINPHIVIQVGLQPTIAGGIILRTPSHQYDFSLRQHLLKTQDILIKAMQP